MTKSPTENITSSIYSGAIDQGEIGKQKAHVFILILGNTFAIMLPSQEGKTLVVIYIFIL